MNYLLRLLSILMLAVAVFSFTEARSLACCQVIFNVQQAEADEDEDEEEDDDEFEDEEDFKNNPWQIDERKLFAAKKFALTNEFAMKVKQIDNICSLDKKQKLKLEIACKGATEKALEGYVKEW